MTKHRINYNTAIGALRRLEQSGLTTWHEVGDRRETVIWSLTEKGTKAAEMLRDLDDFIAADL